jgi:hypothetical protein
VLSAASEQESLGGGLGVNDRMGSETKHLRLAVVVSVMLVAAATGCTGGRETEPVGEVQLSFGAHVAVNAEGECHTSLEVHNEGPGAFGGDSGFTGVMEIRGEDGSPRARMEIGALGHLKPDESVFPASWRGRLLPGKYMLTWGAQKYGSTVVTFGVTEESGRLGLEEQSISSGRAAGGALERIAPETQALVDLALADLAERLDVSPDEIEVVGVVPTQFSDASLGVPEPGMMYAQVVTPGYIIELLGGGESYEYHGSGDRVVLVPTAMDGTSGRLTITGVRATFGQSVELSGRSAGPDGSCVLTVLLADEEIVEWWPSVRCAPVEAGEWAQSVALGEGGAPSDLDPHVQYVVRAWDADEPAETAVLCFDTAGPAAPPLGGG